MNASHKLFGLVVLTVIPALGIVAGPLLYGRFCDHQFEYHQVPTEWLDEREQISTLQNTMERQFLSYRFCPRPEFQVGDIVFVKKIGVMRITEVIPQEERLQQDMDYFAEKQDGSISGIVRTLIQARD